MAGHLGQPSGGVTETLPVIMFARELQSQELQMGFLKEIKGWLGLDPDSSTRVDQVSKNSPLFVYIKILADLGPVERGERFEDPLQEALEKENLGAITGGGSQLSADNEDGQRSIEFCGIDVDLYDAVKGLALLRRELVRLQAPHGTELLYELDGNEWEEPVYRLES